MFYKFVSAQLFCTNGMSEGHNNILIGVYKKLQFIKIQYWYIREILVKVLL